MHLRTASFLLFALLAASLLKAEIQVSARFEPARVAAGNSSKYIVEIIESDSSSMPTPEPITSLPIPSDGGLTLRNGHTSTSKAVRAINGVSEYTTTQQLIIDAVASTPGNFTIPAYIFEYKGGRLQAPEATLNVVERPADAGPTVDELIFLTAEAPEQLYVGQTTPISLKLFVSNRVQLHGLNAFERSTDGFTVSELPEESSESIEMYNGRRYRVLSWPLTITPISAGKQDLNFQFTLTAQMPDQENSRNSPFGNSLFDNFFGRSERFNVYTAPTQIDVKRLPTEGKPKSFSGAIGEFNMEVTTDSTSTRVGEPIMLSMKLSGRGNFDRIKGPELPESPNWRHYNPESSFEPDKMQPLKGVKRFDTVFIPETAGDLELPEVKFSFFDPQVQKYIELSSPPIPVTVAPSDRPISATAPLPTAGQTSSAPTIDLSKKLNPEELLLTLDYRPSSGRRIQKDLLTSPLFYGLNSAALLALIGASVVLYRRNRLSTNAEYAFVQQAKQALKVALNESQSDDAATFYRSAQEAIRLAVSVRLKRNLSAADFSELEALLKQDHVAEDTISQARNLFNEADTHRFSGRNNSADLQRSRTQLNSLLKAL
jgi:hypothetical protein